jgi:ATP-binding cassette, subfamily B, bacterial
MNGLMKIIRYSWVLKKYYIATAFFVVFIAFLNQATPFLTKAIIEGLQKPGHNIDHLWSYYGVIILGILAVELIIALVSNIQGYIGDLLGAKLNTYLSQRYYDHILKLPMSYYDNEVAGKITNRLERSINTISQLVQALANNFVGFFVTVIVTLGIIAYYAWPVAVLIAILFPLYIWLTTLSSKSWQKRQEGINFDADIANGRFVETIGSIRVVKSFVQEVAERTFWAKRRESIEAQTKDQSKEWHKFDIYRRGALGIVFFLIYGYITYMAIKGRLTIPEVVLLLQLVQQAQFPLFASSFIIDNLQRAQAGSKDFFAVMDTEPNILDQPNAGRLNVSKGAISFENVSFAYQDGQPVLQDISFKLEPGTKLALVGESGEGKTTISNLLLRFYSLSSGTIKIDGTDICGVTQTSLRENIGVVFQEPTLFSGTVRENIAYGSPDATEEDISKAAKAANATAFITKLPKGYDTEVGERGVKLSGGQKQRIAIARAILKDAPILILDEATSSLDSRAEAEVQTALEELMKGRTTLIIAHRLSTIAKVDKIVGIRGGRIAEEGSPAELAKGTGIYAELLALQSPTAANKAKLKKYDIAR